MDVENVPFVHVAGGNEAGGNEVAKPLCGIRFSLVVVRAAHGKTGVPSMNALVALVRITAAVW
jgi:hypothetical protein